MTWAGFEMTNHLQDRVILITGAARGFGRLLAEKAARLGARVVAADIDEAALSELVAGFTNVGLTIRGHRTDVTDRQAFRQLVDFTVEAYGGVDVLVNNAGTMPLAFIADHRQAAQAWDRCIDINLKGVLNGIIAVHDQMIEQGRGHVVNFSSIYGNYPTVGSAVYGATKAAVNFLSEALRQESRGKIKVTNIRPTGVPATSLGSSVVNKDAIAGVLGANAADYRPKYGQVATGELPAEEMDSNSMSYWALSPEELVDQVVYAINQPWGVCISDITVRASADAFVV